MRKTTFFCDRCGKKYLRTSGRYLKLLNNLDNPYDLCPECFESLQKWFNRESVEREDSCQFCKYVDKDVHEEPCSKCKYNFLDKFEFRQKEGE